MNNAFTPSVWTPIISFVANWLTTYLRNVPWFNLVNRNDGKKTHILAGVLSALLTFVVAVLTGSLSENLVSNVLQTIVESAYAYAGSVALHEVSKADKPAAPPTPEAPSDTQ